MPLISLMNDGSEVRFPPQIIATMPAAQVEPIRLGRRWQRSRKRGARTPHGVVYAGRPTVLGNPFTEKASSHVSSVNLYEMWVRGNLSDLRLEWLGYSPREIEALGRWRARLWAKLPTLVGADLQCWCPLTSRWCHADVLLKIIGEIARTRAVAATWVPAGDEVPF